MRLALLAPLLALPLVLAACPWLSPEEPVGPPCEDDLNGCSNDGGEFEEDPSCELTGELEVEIGEGETSFMEIPAGAMPEVITGFQGGQHVWMGVRVKNPDLTRPTLKVSYDLSYCNADDCSDPSLWVPDNIRELVIGSRTLEVSEEGWFEQASILVLLNVWGGAEHRRVEMLVTDPCSRQGYAVIED